jgi:hypothetical protein
VLASFAPRIKQLMKMRKSGLVLTALFFSSLLIAQTNTQQNVPNNNTKDSSDRKQPKVVIAGLVITRFTQSFDPDVDINGRYHSDDQGYSTSSFTIRRARIQAKAQLNPRTEAALLLNLTDFVGNPAYKVVENAFVKYHFNNYINLQVGQFRPYFGREDLYPEELLQTLEWTNQYYAFGADGWQSFQVGTTLFGKADILKIPVSYYLGVFNGNGRNQPMDNDNGKLFPTRIELGLRPKTKLGFNGGLGKDGGEKVWAYGVDIDHVEKLGKKWEIEIQSEYKRGNNNAQFDTSSERNKVMEEYQLSGWYVLPNLKYYVNSSQVRSVELSCRCENLNCDFKRKGSTKQTIMPVASVQLGEESFLRLEAGLIIDRYSITSNKNHDATRFVCQLKARF